MSVIMLVSLFVFCHSDFFFSSQSCADERGPQHGHVGIAYWHSNTATRTESHRTQRV